MPCHRNRYPHYWVRRDHAGRGSENDIKRPPLLTPGVIGADPRHRAVAVPCPHTGICDIICALARIAIERRLAFWTTSANRHTRLQYATRGNIVRRATPPVPVRSIFRYVYRIPILAGIDEAHETTNVFPLRTEHISMIRT